MSKIFECQSKSNQETIIIFVLFNIIKKIKIAERR
jgi:hypothetical protein